MEAVNLFWFRRDLRLEDNAGLYHALRSGKTVIPIFIFDTDILDKLEEKKDARLVFIHAALEKIQTRLQEMGSSLMAFHGRPEAIFQQLVKRLTISEVYTNRDYELYAMERDQKVNQVLNENGGVLHSFKDQVIFEKDEILKDDGKPYTVFTPYSKKWKAVLTPFQFKAYPTEKYFGNFYKQDPQPIPSLEAMGFEQIDLNFPTTSPAEQIIRKYQQQRNFPAIESTSRLGVHLRFGTISIREVARRYSELSETFLNELIWRDFYHMILWHFPEVGRGKAFKEAYDHIEWRRDEGEFKKWCEGNTGYPIVDAGMRELNATGFMHNRVRMIVASFLTKHLLLDWRLGEAYFAEKLLDFDFAANNGGWQWASGSGCDSAPYFRIFNPYLQTEKFDPKLEYIKKWVPEFQEFTYPKPIVDHSFARTRCLEVYTAGLKNAKL